MDFSYEDFIKSENITDDVEKRIKKFAPIAEKFFTEKNLPVTEETLKSFKEFCITEKIGAKSTVENGISALRKLIAWRNEKENEELKENNISENITSENEVLEANENNISEDIINEDNTDENNIVEDITNDNIISVKVKKEMKKISVNIEKKKFQQLQILAIKHDKNITDYITVAIDKILQEHKSELENITGIF